ncbi:Uu.00g009320.m01.CDS01 [Anthostomella pinea]|uniref:Uu.00g009320.m01.CDS01 n=1 Tax=Anthostomella pinea TaxID=933095 RepID=A0AAI8YPX4_9PEZI|nr:Uu.00g009320.m01.CDS01 [Anthostomella pinea]
MNHICNWRLSIRILTSIECLRTFAEQRLTEPLSEFHIALHPSTTLDRRASHGWKYKQLECVTFVTTSSSIATARAPATTAARLPTARTYSMGIVLTVGTAMIDTQMAVRIAAMIAGEIVRLMNLTRLASEAAKRRPQSLMTS